MTWQEFEQQHNRRFADNCSNCKLSELNLTGVRRIFCMKMAEVGIVSPYVSDSFVCDLFERKE